jgi:hypothetical protein
MERPNPISPERMTPDARLAEVGRILASALIRMKASKSSSLSLEAGDSLVDFVRPKSGSRCGRNNRIGNDNDA